MAIPAHDGQEPVELECMWSQDGSWWAVDAARCKVLKRRPGKPALQVVFAEDGAKDDVGLDELAERLRPAGRQVQDSECALLQPGMEVIALHRHVPEGEGSVGEQKFYDAVVEAVTHCTRPHGEGEGDCQCQFLVRWKPLPRLASLVAHGAQAPEGTAQLGIESLCFKPPKAALFQHPSFKRWQRELAGATHKVHSECSAAPCECMPRHCRRRSGSFFAAGPESQEVAQALAVLHQVTGKPDKMDMLYAAAQSSNSQLEEHEQRMQHRCQSPDVLSAPGTPSKTNQPRPDAAKQTTSTEDAEHLPSTRANSPEARLPSRMASPEPEQQPSSCAHSLHMASPEPEQQPSPHAPSVRMASPEACIPSAEPEQLPSSCGLLPEAATRAGAQQQLQQQQEQQQQQQVQGVRVEEEASARAEAHVRAVHEEVHSAHEACESEEVQEVQQGSCAGKERAGNRKRREGRKQQQGRELQHQHQCNQPNAGLGPQEEQEQRDHHHHEALQQPALQQQQQIQQQQSAGAAEQEQHTLLHHQQQRVRLREAYGVLADAAQARMMRDVSSCGNLSDLKLQVPLISLSVGDVLQIARAHAAGAITLSEATLQSFQRAVAATGISSISTQLHEALNEAERLCGLPPVPSPDTHSHSHPTQPHTQLNADVQQSHSHHTQAPTQLHANLHSHSHPTRPHPQPQADLQQPHSHSHPTQLHADLHQSHSCCQPTEPSAPAGPPSTGAQAHTHTARPQHKRPHTEQHEQEPHAAHAGPSEGSGAPPHKSPRIGENPPPAAPLARAPDTIHLSNHHHHHQQQQRVHVQPHVDPCALRSMSHSPLPPPQITHLRASTLGVHDTPLLPQPPALITVLPAPTQHVQHLHTATPHPHTPQLGVQTPLQHISPAAAAPPPPLQQAAHTSAAAPAPPPASVAPQIPQLQTHAHPHASPQWFLPASQGSVPATQGQHLPAAPQAHTAPRSMYPGSLAQLGQRLSLRLSQIPLLAEGQGAATLDL